jgi:beta-lactamase regulating signal transducer with metallopeptidase domain
MHEYIARPFYYFEVHLLYASMVWFGAWALTSFPAGTATTKYWIWVATSLNFMLPLGAVLDRVWRAHLSWARPIGVIGSVGVIISENLTVASVLGVVWLVGVMLMLVRLFLRIRNEHRKSGTVAATGVQDGTDLFAYGVPVRFGASSCPAVDGILHPHISLPQGIEGLLTGPELNAVLLHERTHARRRDNLIRLIHEIGLCLLWFHPLMWVTGSRLALYRELSCDESAIRGDHGQDLVSALAKLTNPEGALLLQASASSFISHRLLRLNAVQPGRTHAVANALLVVLFGAAIMTGVYGIVAHTACCFRVKAKVAACQHR